MRRLGIPLPALLLSACLASATYRTAGPAVRIDDGLVPVHVHNASPYVYTVAIGELRDPAIADCGLLRAGERLSVRAFALRTVELGPGENVGVEGLAGDGSCGVVQITVAGTSRAVGWRTDEVERVEVPPYGVIDTPGRLDIGGAGMGTRAPFFEVPTAR